jgi:glutamate racemase
LKIGVFDSGVGGASVVNAIKDALPNLDVVLAEDKKNLPYGNKSPEQLYNLVLPILNTLSNSGCDVIVIACNTVSTTLMERLKQVIHTPLIGVEPMVKEASFLTKTGIITVCATPTTLGSGRYSELKKQFASNNILLEPDCSQWAYLIETDQIDRFIIRGIIKDVIEQNSDVIVLGCTHYHWIEKDIKEIVGDKAIVLQPESEIVEQLKRVIEQLG